MIRQFRKQWLRWHKKYERTAFVIYQRSFKDIANGIPWERMTSTTYEALISFYVPKEKIDQAYYKVYKTIGLVHGKRTGTKINKQINQKNFTLDTFINLFERTLLTWLIDNGGQRITSVRSTYIEYLNEIIARGISDGKNMSQIVTEMQKLINSRKFYRNDAFRIARTETTTAANYAATMASESSGVVMDKVWISALDGRTRRKPPDRYDHYDMNQKKVGLNNYFIVSGEEMLYPGDPNGSAGNVINCRCTVAQVARRDSTGRIIRI